MSTRVCIRCDRVCEGCDNQDEPHYCPSCLLRKKEEEQARATAYTPGPLERAKDGVRALIELVGDDPQREGVRETPARVVKAFREMCSGYAEDPADILKTCFLTDNDQMIVERNLDLWSLCEHHLLPFHGKAHIGYIPGVDRSWERELRAHEKTCECCVLQIDTGKGDIDCEAAHEIRARQGKRLVAGLSKLPRLVNCFSRRMQIQEQLTQQIAEALQKHLKPVGVGVVIEANHLCMCARGVRAGGSSAITSCLLGAIREQPEARAEFLALAWRG